METIIPQPNREYFKLSAPDATRVAWKLAARYEKFNWQLFRVWTQAYGEVNKVKTLKPRKQATAQTRQMAMSV